MDPYIEGMLIVMVIYGIVICWCIVRGNILQAKGGINYDE